jgi:hypothetical protein
MRRAGVGWVKFPKLGGFAVAVFGIGACLFNASVAACSLGPDYKGPETNFELVQQADRILIGTLVRSEGNDLSGRKILVRPTHLLKGPSLPKEVSIRGFLSDEPIKLPDKEIRVRATKSAELDLWRPHPEVWIGGCSRQTFDRGMQVVLFFNKDGGKLGWFDPAFSRSSEDVSGTDALWVRAVKLYAQISQLPLGKQKPALKAEMLKLRDDSFGNGRNMLLADDIERHLAGVGPVSRFDIARSTADENRWLNNIVNETYHGQITVQTDVVSPEKPRKIWQPSWVIGGIVVILGAIIFVYILRNRVRKPA